MIGNPQAIEGKFLEILLTSIFSLLKLIARLVGFFGIFNCIVMIVLFIIFVIWLFNKSASARRRRLLEKYGNTDIFERIMKGTIWIGQTSEQLRDACGAPIDVNETVTLTKTSQVWKYDRRGQNRYALHVSLNDDIVVGWTTSHE